MCVCTLGLFLNFSKILDFLFSIYKFKTKQKLHSMVYSSSSNISSLRGIPFLKWLNNLAAAISPVLINNVRTGK